MGCPSAVPFFIFFSSFLLWHIDKAESFLPESIAIHLRLHRYSDLFFFFFFLSHVVEEGSSLAPRKKCWRTSRLFLSFFYMRGGGFFPLFFLFGLQASSFFE